VIAAMAAPRRLSRSEVLTVCRDLERRACADPPRRAVAIVQDMRFASPRARDTWRRLAAAGVAVRVYGRDLPAVVTDGVPGRTLDDDDPAVDVWAFCVEWPDGRCDAMAAVDIAPETSRDDPATTRDFWLVESREPATVRRAFDSLDSDASGRFQGGQ
jgi:hypothetical protein